MGCVASGFGDQCNISYVTTLRRGGQGAGCRVRLVFTRQGCLSRPVRGVTAEGVFCSRGNGRIHAGGRVLSRGKAVHGEYGIVGGNRICRERVFAVGSTHFGRRRFLSRIGMFCASIVGKLIGSRGRGLSTFGHKSICLTAGGVNGGGPGTSGVALGGGIVRS